MKKMMSVLAVSALVVTANVALAGGPGQKTEGCPEKCQDQIDSLQSGQALQDEKIKSQAGMIDEQAAQLAGLSQGQVNPWYGKVTARLAMVGDMDIESFGAKIESDTGYGGGLAIGRKFGNFRTDLEIATQKSDLKAFDSGDVRLDTVMLNGTYDFPIAAGFSLYATVGLGVGKVDLTIQQVDDSETTFAYKGGVGATYAFTEKMFIDLGYEYLATSDVNISGLEIEDIKSNNVVAAFRYDF